MDPGGYFSHPGHRTFVFMIRTLYHLLRPLAAVPFAFALTLGAVEAGFKNPLFFILMLVVIILTVGGAGHIINSYFDRRVDAISKIKKDITMANQPFARGAVTLQMGFWLFFGLNIAGLAALWAIGPKLFWLGLAIVMVSAAYSAPPLRLKSRPIFDILANAGLAIMATVLGFWFFADKTAPLPWPLLVWLGLLVGATYIFTLVVDYPDDLKNGIKTTAVWLGVKNILRLGLGVYAAMLLTLAYSIWQSPRVYQITLAPVLLFGFFKYLSLTKRHHQARIRRAMFKAGAAAGAGLVILVVVYSILFFVNLTHY